MGNPAVLLLGLACHRQLVLCIRHNFCYWTAVGFGCLLWLLGKFQRQSLVEKRKGVLFKSYTVWEDGRILLQTQCHAEHAENPGRVVKGCSKSSCSYLKILSFRNLRQLWHGHPGGLSCSQLQCGFRLLCGVCVCCQSHLSAGGFQDEKGPPIPTLHPCHGSKRKCTFLPFLCLNLLVRKGEEGQTLWDVTDFFENLIITRKIHWTEKECLYAHKKYYIGSQEFQNPLTCAMVPHPKVIEYQVSPV